MRKASRNTLKQTSFRAVGSLSKKHFPDNPKPSDHLKFLTGPEDGRTRHVGIRRLGEKPFNIKQAPFSKKYDSPLKAFKASDSTLSSWIDYLAGEEKVYITQADFFWGPANDKDRARCDAGHLLSIGLIYVDLDCYNSAAKNLNMDEIVRGITHRCRSLGVPLPLIISSGRGAYAIWPLKERIYARNENDIEAWRDVQLRLMQMLSFYGPDTKVRDLTRVLRLVGTKHEKSGEIVKVVFDNGLRYHLADLVEATKEISAIETPQSIKQAKKESKQKNENVSDKVSKPAKKSTSKTKADKSKQTKKKAVTKKKKKKLVKPLSGALDRSGITPNATLSACIQDLLHTVEQERKRYNSLSRNRKFYFRVYSDIANLIAMRKGLLEHERDEHLFWLCAFKFNAGLLRSKDLQKYSKKISFLCHDPLDVWEQGYLSTLYNRMQTQEAIRSENRPVTKRKNASSAFSYSRFKNTKTKDGFNLGRVYTPSIATLIGKLDINESEQYELDVLNNEAVRRQKTLDNSVSANRAARNELIVTKFTQSNTSVKDLAKEFGLSQASVYRIISTSKNESLVKQRQAQSESHRSLVQYSYENPQASIRDLSSLFDVSTSTAYRLVKVARQRSLAYALQVQRRNVIENLSSILLLKEFNFPHVDIETTSVRTGDVVFNVPFSYSLPNTIMGRENICGDVMMLCSEQYIYKLYKDNLFIKQLSFFPETWKHITPQQSSAYKASFSSSSFCNNFFNTTLPLVLSDVVKGVLANYTVNPFFEPQPDILWHTNSYLHSQTSYFDSRLIISSNEHYDYKRMDDALKTTHIDLLSIFNDEQVQELRGHQEKMHKIYEKYCEQLRSPSANEENTLSDNNNPDDGNDYLSDEEKLWAEMDRQLVERYESHDNDVFLNQYYEIGHA